MSQATALYGCGLALLLCSATVFSAQDEPAAPDDHDHEAHAVADEIPMSSLTPEGRNRVRRLQTEIMCDCDNENFSRTLGNCPDTCARPQKMIIRRMVRDGRTDEQIFQTMLQRVGQDQRVLARAATPFGRLVYVLPFAFLLLCLGVAFGVLRRWSDGGRRDRARREKTRALLSDEELNRVERELAELD